MRKSCTSYLKAMLGGFVAITAVMAIRLALFAPDAMRQLFQAF